MEFISRTLGSHIYNTQEVSGHIMSMAFIPIIAWFAVKIAKKINLARILLIGGLVPVIATYLVGNVADALNGIFLIKDLIYTVLELINSRLAVYVAYVFAGVMEVSQFTGGLFIS